MARIPGVIEISPQRAPDLPLGATYEGDLGLGDLAKSITEAARSHQERANFEGKVAVTKTMAEAEEAAKTASVTYNGEEGYAAARIAELDAAAAHHADTLKGDARIAFTRQMLDHRADFANRVQSQEATVRGAIERQRRDDSDDAEAGKFAAVTGARSLEQLRAATNAYDPAKDGPDLIAQSVAILDQDTADTLAAAKAAGASPSVLAKIEKRLNNNAITYLQLQSGNQIARKEAHAATTLGETAGALGLQVRTSPDTWAASRDGLKEALSHTSAEFQDSHTQDAMDGLGHDYFFGKYLKDEDYEGALRELTFPDSPVVKSMSAEAVRRETATVTDVLNSQAHAERQVRAAADLAAHLASIRENGPEGATTFDMDKAFKNDPGGRFEAERMITQAATDHEVNVIAPTLPIADQNALLAKNKPDPKNTSMPFDMQVARYDALAKAIADGRNGLVTDPAATLTKGDKQLQEAWLKAADSPADAQRYADTILNAEATRGTAEGARRILPVGEAQRQAHLVANAPEGKEGDALMGAYAYALRYGDKHAGRVLREIAGAGLKGADYSVLATAGDNILTVNRYARAVAIAKTVHPKPSDLTTLRDNIATDLAPLLRSYRAQGAAGARLADGLQEATETFALANVNDGLSLKKAAEAGAANFNEKFGYRGLWRLPAAENHQWTNVASFAPREEVMRGVRVPVTRHWDPGQARPSASGLDTIELGAFRTKRDLLVDDPNVASVVLSGKKLLVVSYDKHLSAAQNQSIYANDVADNGVWINTQDEKGLMLVMRQNNGEFIPVKTTDGKPVVRTWRELAGRASRQ